MASLSLLAPTAEAKPVVIYGNAYGLWSPTHPHVTGGQAQAPGLAEPKPNSPVLYTPPEPEPEEVAETPDVCPTLQSAPHLCQTLKTFYLSDYNRRPVEQRYVPTYDDKGLLCGAFNLGKEQVGCWTD
jgi:hypothetical protein